MTDNASITINLKVAVLEKGSMENVPNDKTVTITDLSKTILDIKKEHLAGYIDNNMSIRFIFGGKVLLDSQKIGEFSNLGPVMAIHVVVRGNSESSLGGFVSSSKAGPLIMVHPSVLILGSIFLSGGALSFAWRRNTSRSPSVSQLYFLIFAAWLCCFLLVGLPAIYDIFADFLARLRRGTRRAASSAGNATRSLAPSSVSSTDLKQVTTEPSPDASSALLPATPESNTYAQAAAVPPPAETESTSIRQRATML